MKKSSGSTQVTSDLMKLLMTTLVVTTSNVQSEQLSKAAFDKREVFHKEEENCDGESYGSRLNTNLLKEAIGHL